MVKLLDFSLSDQWPFALRVTMYALGALWLVSYGYLKAFPPEKPVITDPLEFTEFRQIDLTEAPGSLSFALTVINNTDKSAQVTSLKLEWFDQVIPAGGLQSNKGVDAIYVVSRSAEGLIADSGDGARSEVSVSMNKPYASSDYLLVSLDLAERVRKEEDTRFFVQLKDGTVLPPDTNTLRATLQFSNGTTATREIELQ